MKPHRRSQQHQPQSPQPRQRQRHPKTLILLLILIFTVAASIAIAIFVSPSTEDRTLPANDIYDEVIAYDFSAGRSPSLETKIKDAVEKSSVVQDNDIETHNLALKAKTIYYFNITKYHTAISTLQELEEYAGEYEDYVFIADLYSKTYDLLGNSKLAAYYQEEYDNLTRTCDTADTADTDTADTDTADTDTAATADTSATNSAE